MIAQTESGRIEYFDFKGAKSSELKALPLLYGRGLVSPRSTEYYAILPSRIKSDRGEKFFDLLKVKIWKICKKFNFNLS